MLPFYTSLRDATRGNALVFGFIAMTLVLVVLLLAYRMKKYFAKYARQEEGRIVIFGFVMAFISLMPFIDLGNISERYGYLSSIGFCLSLAVLIQSLFASIFRHHKRTISYWLAAFLFLISIFFVLEIRHEFSDWQHAGTITHRTLSTFRVKYELMPHGSTLYFVNVPVKFGMAWVFPYTSIQDGLWFVYRDNTEVIHVLSSVDQAKQLYLQDTAGLPTIKDEKMKKYYIIFSNLTRLVICRR